LNLRKNWRAAQRLKPDVIVVLGDMMDAGREDMPDEEYESYFNRFRSIFRFSVPTNVHYVPGNHDIGLGNSSVPVSSHARHRFYTHFGPFNKVVKLTDHYSLVIVDSPGLLDENEERLRHGLSLDQWSDFGGAMDFVGSFWQASHSLENHNLILFSHIPLHRPLNTECGSLRERGVIRPGKGAGYQNLLPSDLSQFLLNNIKPVLVLSGDDHDYCEIIHPNNIREVTVKSISMAMGIRRPGFQLISIPVNDIDGYADQPCLLPDQLRIYLKVYLPCAVITILILHFGPSLQTPGDGYLTLPSIGGYRGKKSSSIGAAAWLCPPVELRRRKGSGFRRLVNDFWDVAWPPLSVFFVVTLYMFLT